MIGRLLKDIINLLIYGGAFIGLCASSITALTFELTGRSEENLPYILLIGAATAALYTIHRIIGLHKSAHVKNSDRFTVIRKYQFHIRVYSVLWILLSLWLLIPLFSITFILWLLPGGIIGFSYVFPLLSGGRRLRDLGWGKIMMIGWSWSWLTAVVPLWYFTDGSIQMTVIHGLERFLFIMLITIPFEIRDLYMDKSLGLITMPEKLGRKRTRRVAGIMCGVIIFLSLISSFHYFNPPYVIAMALTSLSVLPMINYSYLTADDYFFGGLVDGTMIIAVWVFKIANIFI
ncbi:MAG: UbiA family prenyltransferase [Saprospiraceae bacterium]|nr:UbiA family prenyltransferase [Saprospiraceae bacterium]